MWKHRRWTIFGNLRTQTNKLWGGKGDKPRWHAEFCFRQQMTPHKLRNANSACNSSKKVRRQINETAGR